MSEAAPKADRRRLISCYYDTPDQRLWKHGLSLRVRQSEQQRVQTLKQETSSLIERGEWEGETAQDAPDLDAINAKGLGLWFNKRRLREKLKPQFKVDVERASMIVDSGAARVEAALDEGVIEAQGRSSAVSELELELKQGDKPALYGMARALSREAPIYLSLISKAERGFLLGDRRWGRAAKATRPKLAPDATTGMAFEAICRCCLHDFVLNIQALETTDRVEGVHRGRVALRRLRAALQLFEPVVADESSQRLDDELKRLAHLFGEARDLDVFQEGTFLPAAENAAIAGAQQLAEQTEARRNAAHDAVNAAVKSNWVRLLLIDVVDWIEDGAWRRSGSKEAQKPIEAFARQALMKRRKRLVKQDADLANLDPRSRHKIRIKTKKLRYMVDFFKHAPKVAAKPKAMEALLVCLENPQARLGKIHDEDAKAAFLEQVVRELPGHASHMAAFAAGALAARRDLSGELEAAVDAYSKLAKTKLL